VIDLRPMKRIISIGLIILMSVQSFFKLGVITYFQLNREYIAEVLCINKAEPITMCYGQCFLKKNLDLADHSPKSTAPVAKDKVELPSFLISEMFYSLSEAGQLPINNTHYCSNYSTVKPEAPFHPPTIG
jgi:hypothetical protein